MTDYEDRNAYADRSRESGQYPAPEGARNRRASGSRTWLLRFAIVLGVGLMVGAGGGVIAVNTLEPGRPSEPDSVQVLLDSIERGVTPPARGAATTDGDDGDAGAVTPDTVIRVVEPIVAPDTTSVPDVTGMQEGAARTILLGNGMTVGPVEFRASASEAGTVLATIPVFGTPVARGTAVTLVLSDGRTPVDTLRIQDSPSRR
ncbi:MAG TPA: PASTA domain-containing protein [Gemmatimonas sp.]|nr:PASTA domain-containing protein [Gemmatimonas sp.]